MIKDISYSPEEFFYDNQFEDYDIVERENFNKRVRESVDKIQRDVGILVGQKLITMGPVLKEFREYLEISEDDLFKILHGEYELDLRLVSRMESFLNIEIIKIIDD